MFLALAVLFVSVVFAATVNVPTTKLSNGVEMPVMVLGVGASTWRNNTATAQSVLDGLVAGFPGIDTANNYRNQVGVAQGMAVREARGGMALGRDGGIINIVSSSNSTKKRHELIP